MARDLTPVALSFGFRGFQRPRSSIERSIAAVADTQLGLVTTEQLLALGLSQAAIDRRVASGRLMRVYRGVFAVARSPRRCRPTGVADAVRRLVEPGRS